MLTFPEPFGRFTRDVAYRVLSALTEISLRKVSARMTNPRPRVLVADDYEDLLAVFKRLLEPLCEVVGCVADVDGGRVRAAAEGGDRWSVRLSRQLPKLARRISDIERRTPRTQRSASRSTTDTTTSILNTMV